jgi:hypothetical protein
MTPCPNCNWPHHVPEGMAITIACAKCGTLVHCNGGGKVVGGPVSGLRHTAHQKPIDPEKQKSKEQVLRFVALAKAFAAKYGLDAQQYTADLAARAKQQGSSCQKVLKLVAQKIRISNAVARRERLVRWLRLLSIPGQGVGDTVKRLLPLAKDREIETDLKQLTQICGCTGMDWVDYLNRKYSPVVAYGIDQW